MIAFLLTWGLTNATYAQTDHLLTLSEANQNTELTNYTKELPQVYLDSVTLVNALSTLLQQLHNDAYLAATIDKLEWKDSTAAAVIDMGKRYEWTSLQNGNVEAVFLDQVGFRERLFDGKPFKYPELIKIQEALITYAENNGYPFAAVWLDSIEIDLGKIGAKLFMRRNRLITIDKVNIIGSAKITPRYLENYLDLRAGDLYSKAKIIKIRDRLRELPFVTERQNPTVTFKGNEAVINLFIDKKNASRFDFLIGVQPNTQSVGSGGPEVRTVQFTGTFNADMNNQFGQGERIYVEFQQLRPLTQELNLELAYPYILNLPFGVDGKFDLFKRDTTNLNIESDVGIQYFFSAGNFLRFFWNNRATNVLSVNEQQILSSRKLPATLDVARSSFGLEYQLSKLNYRYNPRKGWSTMLRGSAGVKRTKKNSKILALQTASFNPNVLYDTLSLRSFQYQLEGQINYFIPLGKRATLKTEVKGGYIISNNPIYQNEQFRIGGNRLLRGFDEESIFTTNYAVSTLELRLLLGLNSYLFAFGDFGYTENITTDRRDFDHPIGMGAGITFETKVGLFGFSLAVGKQQNTGFDFRSVKTHFGYVSLF